MAWCTKLYYNIWSQETLSVIYYSEPWCFSVDEKRRSCSWTGALISTPRGLRCILWRQIFNERRTFGGLSISEVGRVHKTWPYMKQLEPCLLVIFQPLTAPRGLLLCEESWRGQFSFSRLWQARSNWHLRSDSLSSLRWLLYLNSKMRLWYII